MEDNKGCRAGDEDEELMTSQIKRKAEEIAKHFEKYQGRYQTSSSRCNTPLPIASADRIESIHSNSFISDTNEKLILFRKFLENDRKLVENSKIEEQNSNDDILLDVKLQCEKEKHNSTYYDDIITTQFNEANIQSLKDQIVALNEKLGNCHNVIIEKDVLLQSKIDKIESLNKVIIQKDKLHMETVEALNRRNVEFYEVNREERSRSTQEINKLIKETDDLKKNLVHVRGLCDELKKDNIKMEKIINEFRKVENQLKLDIEQLNINHENEKKLLEKRSHESSKKIIEGMENELLHLRQENDSLTNQLTLLDSMSVNIQERDNLLEQLEKKEAEIVRLNLENKKLNDQYENQRIEVQQTENRLSRLKKTYLNDKDRMTFLEKVVEELKVNNSDLNNANVKLSEKLEISMENLELNNVNNQLQIVLKENESYKNKCLELDNGINQKNTEIFELKNIITNLNNQITQIHYELKHLKNVNTTISDKLKSNIFEEEQYKILSERYLKQKQLLRLKLKALKESENNCLNLQHQVAALVLEINTSNKKIEDLIHCNKQVGAVLQYCDIDLQNCYALLNKIVIKSNSQNKIMYTLRCILMGLASLFAFDDFKVECNFNLFEILDSISNAVPDDNELEICLKKIIIGSINILEYIININNEHKLSKVQLIARTEVDKLISKAVKRVVLSTRNKYQKQNNELLNLIEKLENDNHTLKLNISSKILETKEVLTDVNGLTVENLLSPENVNIKNENDTLKQFLKDIREILGLINCSESDDIQLQYSVNELKVLVQDIKNENVLLKDQHIEYDSEKSNVIENGDSKVLLVRYKNLKSRYKEVRAKTVELDKKIISLTNDLECANFKYKQLNDQYVSTNDNHETDIVNYQSEVENLMYEKLEAHRQLITLKEKYEILQNDYDQLKTNLDEKNSVNDTEIPTNINEQITVLKRQLNDTQHLIDSAYSVVLCKWPPIHTSSDWVFIQSMKLDEIVNAKCNSTNNCNNSLDAFDLGEVQQLKICVETIHELVTSILTIKSTIDESPTFELTQLMSDLKSCTEMFLEFISLKNNKLHSMVENRVELSHNTENHDNIYPPKELSSSENLSIIKPLMLPKESTPILSGNEETEQFQRSIAERDRLIEFLSDKISKLDNINQKDDIILVREKLDRALTVVHERDVRCDELTLELTRLLEERDMLQLKLSDSIRQVQFLSNSKPQMDASNLLEEKCFKTIDDKLEELHSLEYRLDADLFADQEHRHKSQMELHQIHQDSSSKTQREKSSNVTEEANTSQSWFKDILW